MELLEEWFISLTIHKVKENWAPPSTCSKTLAHGLSIGGSHDEMRSNGIPFKPRYISSGEEGKNACTYSCLVISIKTWCPPLHVIKLSNDKITTKQKQPTTPYKNQN